MVLAAIVLAGEFTGRASGKPAGGRATAKSRSGFGRFVRHVMVDLPKQGNVFAACVFDTEFDL